MAASLFATDPVVGSVVALADYGWTPPGAARPALEEVTLQLAPGECALFGGATGSGKSTLLRAIAGALPPGGVARGRLCVSGHAALLFQDVDTQLLFSTVEEEVASGLRVAADVPEPAPRIEGALARMGLAGFAGRPISDLSAGERQRVVLAALLASEPTLLLLDEPTSALDPAARAQLVAALARLKAHGHTLLIAEHRTAPFRSLADRFFVVDGGRVAVRSAPITPSALTRAAARTPESSAPLLVRGCGVTVRDAEAGLRLPATDLVVHGGERILVRGANGAGKSTLLHVLAGLTCPSQGRVELGETLAQAGGEGLRAGSGRVALVLQNPPRNLFAPSVGEEVAFTLERCGWPAADVEWRVRELLEACGLAHHRERSPLRLSFGEQHCVAIATALASRPALLLLDEPFAGLDGELRRRLLELLDREQARTGMAVLIAGPTREGLEGWAQREISLPPARATSRGPRAPDPAARSPHAAAPGRAFHYRDTGSALHRLDVGWKLLAVVLGSIAAIAARTPLALVTLLIGWVAGYRLARLRAAELWQDTRWLIAQAAVVVALSALRDGSEGLVTGLRTASQIALFFLPGALLLRTSPTGRMLASVRRALPPRLAFALATSLRFVPYFSRELHEIIGVQRLRGAHLALRDLWRPRTWRDAVECVGVPLAVRAIHTANEIARAAEVRGIAAVAAEERHS